MAHTPGPWDVVLVFNSAQDTVGIEIYQDDGSHIACRSGDPEAKANARLIAAAPELLEALDLVASGLRVYNSGGEADVSLPGLERISKAAIAKAGKEA